VSDPCGSSASAVFAAWVRDLYPFGILFRELHQLWRAFDRDLRHGRLKHLEYNSANKTLSWHKPKTNNEEAVQTGLWQAPGSRYCRHFPVCESAMRVLVGIHTVTAALCQKDR
jgi:hypothetical protein